MKRFAPLFLCLACAGSKPVETPAAPPLKPDAATVWKAVVDAPDRSEKDRALDPGRHPAQMLEFLNLKPGMKVADIGAGPGYTTELMARAVGPSGAVYMQNDPSWLSFLKEGLAERATHTAAMKNVTRVDRPFADPLPPELKNLDAVVMNVIYHDIANTSVDRVRMNREIFNALQPGGEYIVIDSSAKNGSGLADTKTLHRIDEAVVKEEVEKAGFKLASESDFLRNPQDARDWNSSPGAATKAGKRGTVDRFALRFVRPEGSAQQAIAPQLRLPPGAKPVHVTAELSIDPKQEFFHGTEELAVALDAATPLLWLNAEDLKILDVQPKATVIDAQPGFIGLQFAQPLPAGAATVKLHWEGKVSSTDAYGAFRQQENGDWYVLSQGEPLGMRKIFPSFDEPGFKVPWKVALRVPKDAAAYFNTNAESETAAGDEKVVQFAETKPLPSYLIAFAVGPFERVDAGKAASGQPIGVVVTKGKTSWAKDAAQAAPKLLDILAAYFQVPYNYPKLDLAEVPLTNTAMENPGLITFGQRGLLAKPGTSTPQFVHGMTGTAAHEFAHLWFGDMVTTAWWDDLWLNEAFATWMSTKAVTQYAPQWNMDANRAEGLNWAMQSDSLVSARRIRQPIESDSDINTAFDGITYGKGAAVINMFEQYVGPDVFRRGVTRYLKAHADGNATAKDFLAAVSAEAGRDIAPAFSTFLDQGGLPLVTAKLSCEGGKGTLALSQSRYLPLGAPKVAEETWQIPVCARTNAGRSCTLLADKSGTLDLGGCPQWVMPNAGASGYYRSALDDDAAAKLTKNVEKLTAPEKILLFSDVDAAAHAGAMDYSRAFELVPALANDKERHVVEMLLPKLSYVRSRGLLPPESQAAYGAFVRNAFGKRARALGFAESKKDNEDTRLLRPEILRIVGDEGGELQLRTEAQKLALKWLADHKTLKPDMASTALYLAALDADALLYDKLHAAAKAETDRVERQRILSAMSAVRDPELAQKGFAIVLSNEFDVREAETLLWGASGDPRTREAVFQFVQKNFDALAKVLPHGDPFEGPAVLPMLASGFCDEEHAAALGALFGPHANEYSGLARRLAQSQEAIRQCAAFKAKAGPELAAYLKK